MKAKKPKKREVFSLLDKRLQKAVKKRFKSPTPIQAEVIPAILKGENVLTISETGSGKTEAVLLPVFDYVVRNRPQHISVLYITPLKALNRDLLDRIIWWANELEFEVSVRHGDTTPYERKMQSENPPDMMISTPETLQAILTGKNLREHLKNVKFIVVDEVHEIVTNKRGVQLTVALERLKELIVSSGGEEPRIIGLSATIGSPQEVADFIGIKNPKIINVEKKGKIRIRVDSPEPQKIDRELSSDLFMGPEVIARMRVIKDLIKERKSVLTFTNTRESAEVLSSRIKAMDKSLAIETHHSSLSKGVRLEAETGFKNGDIKSLFCTSSLELGIDIGSIDFIIQFQSPRQVNKLLQRTGRSGHSLDRTSESVIISSDSDDCFESTAIATEALAGWVEPTRIYPKSLDVLGHQIVGLALEEYRLIADKAYKIIKRAYPFKDLTRDEFFEACDLMQKLRLIWINYGESEGTVLKRRKDAWTYYYENLSTIPDVKNYKIHDIVSQRDVGTLDAEFISLHASPGTAFICKGQAWKVLEIMRDKVMVEPMRGIEAAIPAWEGELIPIPEKIANRIGDMREEISEKLKQEDENDVILWLVKQYPISKNVAKKMTETIREQNKWGFVPTHKNLLIEHYSGLEKDAFEMANYVVIHSCNGSLINDTLGRVLSSILTNRYGTVGLQTDAYRIVLKLPHQDNWKEVIETIKNLKPEEVPVILDLSLPNTELFVWRFIHAAKRLGIISRRADYGKAYLRKIIDVYKDKLPYKEALNEIIQEKLDIDGAMKLVQKIYNKELKPTIKQGLSPIGEMAVKRRYELVATKRPDHEIFGIFKNRLLKTRVKLVCCNCGSSTMHVVNDLPSNLSCHKCHAKLLSVISTVDNRDRVLKKSLKDVTLTDEEKRTVSDLMDRASMVISRGKDAVIALAGRGIGAAAAGRILRKQTKDDELLKDVLKGEIDYAKNKRFWRD
ncbi:MAG: DEAD/DEAH box helicase [Nanoarchaeota archaeon]|nr:DEAD/DEAH box helicase [Nanoarchaeota archaeon]MBU1135865.1 DEAD/DEAH box helicase [Nanoarchaeota archaeon]MBU2519837.1 DEAD/DEAH box helicase [Nanoarchaeota archaeon]